MKRYIDAEKLIAEIERYKQGATIARFDNAGENADYFQGKVDSCDDLTHIIASLQQEQPEVDLEKEMDKFYGMYRDENGKTYAIEDDEPCFDWKEDELSESDMRFARHFYELGLKARKLEI